MSWSNWAEDCHGRPFNYGVELFDGQQPAVGVAVGHDYLGVRKSGERLVGKEDAQDIRHCLGRSFNTVSSGALVFVHWFIALIVYKNLTL